ncbi:pleckstrin homology domain-containing family G member 1-like isoform X2 [Hyposmocoma kahamanoa]|uniref:pleckstrin homology domain-containing family G member 1-like isoform X2 n=1 Tax=Hyposmocoma kahamanoa TaxID=1477025 RepID=UPI000E6DA351|nr:pleckstrin homology domain-containing family G member 1-like isoform X2 [Hyposmocoma kahamanoa]
MTQEELCPRLEEQLNSSSGSNPEDADVIIRPERASVKDMILRFERTAINSFGGSSESLERNKDLGSLTSVLNPIHYLSPGTRPQDRNSIASVNSILSNASEISFESSSSGFISDRKSEVPKPHRPAPPPPAPFNDTPSPECKSLVEEEISIVEKKLSYTVPSGSPVVMRRSRHPPVIRKKSSVGNYGYSAETLWSYGVRQSDLEKLLRLKRSELSDNEEEALNYNDRSEPSGNESSSDDSNGNETSDGKEYIVNVDDGRTDTLSTDHSTDTLINEEDSGDEGDGENLSVVSDERSNCDNVSIKSISSLEMVPYQKYDSITVSSDEFGSEVCHAPDTEFLSVSAVNEWCVSKSIQPVLMPVESKKEKYRRRLTERVNELLHTENVYVERLRHVVENYIPEMSRDDLPTTLWGMKTDIFANIEKIFRFHAEEFLPALRHCENDLKKLGRCFRRFEQRFNMYVMYSRNNKRATRLVFEHKQFFQEKQLELGDRLDLSSYLLEPVQRLPRYKLFLDDLVKTYTSYENERCESDSRISHLSADSDETGGSNGECSDNDETPLESLKLAKTVVEDMLTAVDGIMALENISECPPQLNLLNQGRLLRQSEFFAMDTARRRRQLMRIFLFDKLVLLTVVYRKQTSIEFFIYKDHIPIDDLGITAKEHDQYKFTIWYKKRNLKSYKLETRDPSIRNSWVDEITSLLWEQAMKKKELLLQERKKRLSMVSTNSQESTDDKCRIDGYIYVKLHQ